MSPRRVPVSRRDRPAKPPLSRDGVVSAAVAVMRAEGLERLTMRRLAAELDTGAASLYVYVQNMAELHGAILDRLLNDLDLAGDGDDWHGTLIDVLSAYTGLLFQYPSLARSVLTLRPSGPNYLRLIDRLLGLLESGGIPAGQAAWGVDILLQHATSTAAEQGTRNESVNADDEQEHLAMALHEVSDTDYPNIGRVREELLSGTGHQRLTWSFTVLIAGIRTTPTPVS